MSYIRSGSNPEGLYIFSNGENIYIAQGDVEQQKHTIVVPEKDFNAVLSMWDGVTTYVKSGELVLVKNGTSWDLRHKDKIVFSISQETMQQLYSNNTHRWES